MGRPTGIPISEETREKMRQAALKRHRLGIPISEETREKMRQAALKRHRLRRDEEKGVNAMITPTANRPKERWVVKRQRKPKMSSYLLIGGKMQRLKVVLQGQNMTIYQEA